MTKRKALIPFGQNNEPSIDYILGILEDARITTLERIEGISQTELHWQYAEGWNTIGALLGHLHALENYFSITFFEHRKLNKTELKELGPALKMGEYLPQLITNDPIDFYLDKLAQSREKLIIQIRQLSQADFHKKRKGFDKEKGCNLAWVFYHLAEDEIHHRGQISILRKLYKERLEV